MNWRGGLPIAQVLMLLIAVWVIYLFFKIAQHVQAWPFS